MSKVSDKPRFTTCHAGCGRTVEYKFRPWVVCDECRVARRRDQQRRSAETQRRKRGVAVTKGIEAKCDRCGAPYQRMVAHGRYCDQCKIEVPRERARTISAVLRESDEGRAKRARVQRKWAKARRKRDPAFALRGRINAALNRSLRSGKGGRHWETLVGFTIQQLLVHLERQFVPGMTWDNRDDWHIDHIVPLASFKFETPDCPEFKAAWALSNLRPLWATENIRKNAKRTHLL